MSHRDKRVLLYERKAMGKLHSEAGEPVCGVIEMIVC